MIGERESKSKSKSKRERLEFKPVYFLLNLLLTYLSEPRFVSERQSHCISSNCSGSANEARLIIYMNMLLRK